MLRLVLSVLTGWLECREREVIAYLIEENRLLRRLWFAKNAVRAHPARLSEITSPAMLNQWSLGSSTLFGS